jgi:adenylylsulfate kinase
MIILIFGLSGSGKTVLADEIVLRSNAIYINENGLRADLSADLGFSNKDCLEQARRIGAIARLISSQGKLVVVDFVCPTAETRKAFGKADCRVWVDRIKLGRYEDTNKMWEDPRNEEYDLKINAGISVEQEGDFLFEKTGIASQKRHQLQD